MKNLLEDPEVLCLLKKVDEFDSIASMEENYEIAYDERKAIGTKECFGKAIQFFSSEIPEGKDITINVKVYIRELVPYGRNKGWLMNNFTLMNPEQLVEHMNYLKNLGLNFKTTVEPANNNVKIEFNKTDIKTNAQLRLILFWLRSAYAYPYNLYLADAYTLNDKYGEIGLHNLVPITICSCGKNTYYANIYPDVRFNTAKELEEELKKNVYVSIAYGRTSKPTTFASLVEKKYPEIKRVNPLTSTYSTFRKPQSLVWVENMTRFDLYDKIIEFKQNDTIRRG